MTKRSMKDLSLDERRQILLDLQVEESSAIIERHNITPTVLHHVRYHHGPSSAAVGKGDYHKDLLGDAVHPVFDQVRTLKLSGKNSLEISEQLGIALEKVNAIWGDISAPLIPTESFSWSTSL